MHIDAGTLKLQRMI